MNTEHIKITDINAQEHDLARAASVLRAGGLVVFPTETVYGLGGDATRDEAAKKSMPQRGVPRITLSLFTLQIPPMPRRMP